MKKNLSILFIALCFILFNASCKKDKTTTSTATGKLYFHLHTNIGGNEVENYGDVNTDSTGRKIALTTAQLYISHIEFIRTDGIGVQLDSVIILKTLDAETYFVANVPVGDYKSVLFNVGLDSLTNIKIPGTGDTALNHPEMWYGAAAQPGGYMFLNVAGTIDTTTGANGAVADMQPFNYRIGTLTNFRTVSMPDHDVYTVSTTQDAYVHITIDYSKLFKGIQLNNAANLMVQNVGDNSTANAAAIANNISAMFRYEE